MKQTRHTGYRKAAWGIILITALLLALTPLALYAAENPLMITVNQVFSFPPASEIGTATFTYRLSPSNPLLSVPMPAGSTAAGYSFSITGTDSKEIGPITYNQQGYYEYILFQTVEEEKTGLSTIGRCTGSRFMWTWN